MLDLQNEELFRFKEAVKLIPKNNGKTAHLSILYRWSSVGLKGVRLEFVQAGGTRCTSREAIQRFFNRLTEAESPAPISKTPAQRQREIEAAERELDKAGI
jgi:hypothetical protein